MRMDKCLLLSNFFFERIPSTSHGKLLAEHSPTILPLASAGSVCLRSTTSCLTKLEPASTKGLNFFHTAITKPLYFLQIKNLHDNKLDAFSNFQNQNFFHHNINNTNLHKQNLITIITFTSTVFYNLSYFNILSF